jgi:heme/copper-type cytochrome/quinol oxidase subunit 2
MSKKRLAKFNHWGWNLIQPTIVLFIGFEIALVIIAQAPDLPPSAPATYPPFWFSFMLCFTLIFLIVFAIMLIVFFFNVKPKFWIKIKDTFGIQPKKVGV